MMTLSIPFRRHLLWFVSAGILAVAVGVLVARAAAAAAFGITTVAVLLTLGALCRALTNADALPASQRVLLWTIAAFCLHVLAGLVIWHEQSLVLYLGPDALGYNQGAIGILQHWLSGVPMPAYIAHGKSGYWYLLASLYWLVGVHPDAGIVLNAGLGAGTIPILVDATRRRFGPDATRAVPALLVMLPGFALWSSQLLREAGVYFLMAVAINAAVRLADRATLASCALFGVSIALLVTFRADVGLVLAAGLVVGLSLGARRPAGGFLTGAGLAMLTLALVVGAGLGYSGYHLVTHATFQQLNVIRGGSSTSASGFLATANISSPLRSLRYLPLGLLYFVLGPFPWQIHGLRELAAIPDVVVWWYLLPSLWRGIRCAYQRLSGGLVFDLLPACLLAVLLTLLFANFGTVVRERMQLTLTLVPLIAFGWTQRHTTHREHQFVRVSIQASPTCGSHSSSP